MKLNTGLRMRSFGQANVESVNAGMVSFFLGWFPSMLMLPDLYMTIEDEVLASSRMQRVHLEWMERLFLDELEPGGSKSMEVELYTIHVALSKPVKSPASYTRVRIEASR